MAHLGTGTQLPGSQARAQHSSHTFGEHCRRTTSANKLAPTAELYLQVNLTRVFSLSSFVVVPDSDRGRRGIYSRTPLKTMMTGLMIVL